jgi:hypothetical protein
MDNPPRYFPPQINTGWLNEEMFRRYPGHSVTPSSRTLIEKLTQEYIKFWRLVLSFSDRRVVAPAPILAVQRVHYHDRRRYYDDCMDYFNRFMDEELRWRGRADVMGTIHTVTAYKTLYGEEPPDPWNDIVAEYNLGRPSLHLV